MDIDRGKRLTISFIRVFIVLFVILIVLPCFFDQLLQLISGGMRPGNGSIKVFKDLLAEKAVVSRFLAALKKIILYM